MLDVRLIDANALPRKTVILRRRSYLDGRKYVSENRQAVIAEDIDRAPTIDAVPVVRCRECEYSCPLAKELVACLLWNRAFPCNGFCHEGAKMDGGSE